MCVLAFYALTSSGADYKFGDITKRVIRDMTGNRDYEFGDGAKALSSTSMEAAEAAAAAVIDAGGSAVEAGAAAQQALDDSGYQFGDITKGAVKGFEEKVREATGNEECAARMLESHTVLFQLALLISSWRCILTLERAFEPDTYRQIWRHHQEPRQGPVRCARERGRRGQG